MWHRRARVLVVLSVVAALMVPLVAAPAAGAPGSVQGTVFRDTDFDGAFDAAEIGQVGVTVTLVDSTGATASTTSGDDGTWTIASAALAGPFRVEFTIPPTLGFIAPGPMGTDNIGAIDFVVDGDENVDFGVVNPAHYCESDPDVATNCYVLFDQVAGPNAGDAVLVGATYNASGDGRPGGGGTPEETPLVDADQIGTTWGLGYQTFLDADQSNDLLYAASFMKRFSGYAGGGSNAIYVVDDTGAVADTFNIGTAATDPHDFSLVSGEVRDGASYGEVGRQGFGDLDVSEDQTRLYVMQLADDELVEIDIADPSSGSYGDELRTWDVTGVSLGADSCGAGLLRPFATAINDGKVYIGTVCEGPTIGDLVAFVHELDPATSTGLASDFRLVMSVDLDYEREDIANDTGEDADWQVWDDAFQARETGFSEEYAYPQPWLTDIVFDNGDMVLGLRDRYGDQTGDDQVSPNWPTDTLLYRTDSAGDMIRACGVTSAGVTTWVAENDPSGDCDSTNGAAASGPNGGQEWYAGDVYILSGGDLGHEEISLGGLAQISSSDSVLATGFDTLDDGPGIDGAFSAGLMRLDNGSGARTGSYRIIGGGFSDPGPFGKAAGLGDVEARCAAAPLEIGNYVWFDADADGTADPGEAPLENVVVNLYADTDGDGDPDGPVIGTVTTSATGHYVFTDADVTGVLLPATDYVVEFDITTNSVTGPGGESLSLTTVNTAATDSIDSDPTDIGGGLSQVALTTGGPGSFDHTFDAGYAPGVRIGNLVWLDTDDDGTVDSGETPIGGVTVQVFADDGNGVLDDADIAAGPIGTTTTDAAGNWWLDVPAGGTYYAAIPAGQAPLDGLSSSSGAGSSTATNTTDNNDDGDASTVNGTAFDSITGPITATSLGSMPTGEEDSNTGTAGGGGAETYVNTESGTTRADAESNLTIDMGFAPEYEIGNLVWFDIDNDGVVDAGEPSAEGVTVRLLDTSGNELATTVTDVDGHYEFTDLRPGDFVVEIPASQFAPGAPLDGWFASTGAGVSTDPDNDTDDNSDGSPVGDAVRSGTLTLGPGEPTDEVDESPNGVADGNSNLTVDFGFYQLSLGDQLWLDDDNNGVFDAGEDPAPGVTLELLDESGNVVATTVSGTDGTYAFTGLEEGTYTVRIPASQFATGGPLADRTSSTGNDDATGAAPDPDDDVDDDDNGDLAPDGSVVSLPVTLSAGDEPGADAVDNPTVDFGFIPVGSIAGEVWEDEDEDGVLDPDEDPIPDVRVNLIDPETNTVVATTITGPDGTYLFPNLPPDTYVVEILPPNSATLTTPEVGSEVTDSDLDPATNRTAPIVLGLGENITDVDGGVIVPPALAITGLLGHWPDIVFYALLAMAVGAVFVQRRELLAEVIVP